MLFRSPHPGFRVRHRAVGQLGREHGYAWPECVDWRLGNAVDGVSVLRGDLVEVPSACEYRGKGQSAQGLEKGFACGVCVVGINYYMSEVCSLVLSAAAN